MVCLFVTTLVAMMTLKMRNTPFKTNHVAEFGMRICERAAGDSTAVVTTASGFCEIFRKEESAVGVNLIRSKRFKYFKIPFRTEKYSSHHTRMHGTK